MRDFSRKLIVIHGRGRSLASAVTLILGLPDRGFYWEDGCFLLDREEEMLLRGLPGVAEDCTAGLWLCRLLTGRLLLASVTALSGPKPDVRMGGASAVPEEQIFNRLNIEGVPAFPGARRRRAEQLLEDATAWLAELFQVARQLKKMLIAEDGAELPEEAARTAIIEAAGGEVGHELCGLIDAVRGLGESGGDMDTVGSAVLYAAHVRQDIHEKQGREAVYGQDYRFVFVDYHQGLKHLTTHGKGEILMADVPYSALPDLRGDLEFLKKRGLRLLRYEDHHPVDREGLAELESLKNEGLLGVYAMSGPLAGEEIPPGEERCGADMVYDNLIADSAADGPGPQRLRTVTHAEDFVTDRTELGQLLTALIKGGESKIRLAQILLDALPANDFHDRLRDRGFEAMVDEREKMFAEQEDRLLSEAYLIRLRKNVPQPATVESRGERGTSIGAPKESVATILMAQVPSPEPGKKSCNVGRACQFYSKAVPEADYLFYCYGASLLVARRLSSEDETLNLGDLMPVLGTEGDGGHAGAAVCRPDQNPAFPHRLVSRGRGAGFAKLVKFETTLIKKQGFRVEAPVSCSKSAFGDHSKNGKRLLVTLAVAFIIGLLLMGLPALRPGNVMESNEDFMPHLRSPGGVE